MSSMKTSALTFREVLRASQSQPLHLFLTFPTTIPLTQALPHGVMLQETRVEPGHWLTEAEYIASRNSFICTGWLSLKFIH